MKNQKIVKGRTVDNQTRCHHYHSELDIIAIKFKCCNTYYPCYACHKESVRHPPQRWKEREFDTLAILCGACQEELTIREYLACGAVCPHCQAAFNPKCSNHYDLYFDFDSKF